MIFTPTYARPHCISVSNLQMILFKQLIIFFFFNYSSLSLKQEILKTKLIHHALKHPPSVVFISDTLIIVFISPTSFKYIYINSISVSFVFWILKIKYIYKWLLAFCTSIFEVFVFAVISYLKDTKVHFSVFFLTSESEDNCNTSLFIRGYIVQT